VSHHLGGYFKEQRDKRGLSLGQLARLLGYRNTSKGANRISRFERQGAVTADLLLRLADALGIDLGTIEGLLEQDRQERLRDWEEWANEPVPMRLIVRYAAAAYGKVALPGAVTTPEQAERYACAYAREHGRRVCLALSRRLSVWINEDGRVEARTEATPDTSNVPSMRLKGGGEKFLLNFGGRPVSEWK
jgi:transcriptional regulator with XRE-family HTH domain